MQLHNEVIFLHGQSIDEEKATTLGIQGMFHSMLELIDHMRRLHIDQYECVALKVIILICPGTVHSEFSGNRSVWSKKSFFY